MTTSDTKMPKWPNPDDFYPPAHLIPPGSSPVDAHVLRYERARADYWEARARVAVEALTTIERCKCGPNDEFDNEQECAREALSAIGPLPKEDL